MNLKFFKRSKAASSCSLPIGTPERDWQIVLGVGVLFSILMVVGAALLYGGSAGGSLAVQSAPGDAGLVSVAKLHTLLEHYDNLQQERAHLLSEKSVIADPAKPQ